MTRGGRRDHEHLEIPYDLLSILESDGREELLTLRQRAVLEAAVRNGYSNN